MTAPVGYDDYRHIELFMHLPGDWPLDKRMEAKQFLAD